LDLQGEVVDLQEVAVALWKVVVDLQEVVVNLLEVEVDLGWARSISLEFAVRERDSPVDTRTGR